MIYTGNNPGLVASAICGGYNSFTGDINPVAKSARAFKHEETQKNAIINPENGTKVDIKG